MKMPKNIKQFLGFSSGFVLILYLFFIVILININSTGLFAVISNILRSVAPSDIIRIV